MAGLALASLLLAARGATADPPDVGAAVPAQAPSPGPSAADPGPSQAGPASSPATSWLSAYRFHLSAESLRTQDPRFNWDAHFGGDIDVADYGTGRVNVLADYEVVIGSQLRAIDPNQSAYRLEASASWRTREVEVQAFLHHMSRHLSDRANSRAVAWNGVGAAAAAQYGEGPFSASVSVSGMKIVDRAFVDYTAQFETQLDGEYRLSRTVGVLLRGGLKTTAVDPQVAGRGTQTTGRAESGVRLYGKAAAIELFGAWERRLDPYPLERGTLSWVLFGFRFVNR